MHGNTQLWFQSVDLKSDKVRNVETGDKRRTVNTEYLFPCCVSRVYTVHTIDTDQVTRPCQAVQVCVYSLGACSQLGTAPAAGRGLDKG